MKQNSQRKLNTETQAWDGFGTELKVDDEVAVALSRWTGDYIMYRGVVKGWTEKTIKVLITAGATNSDKPAGMEYRDIIGKISNRNPDKVIKLNS